MENNNKKNNKILRQFTVSIGLVIIIAISILACGNSNISTEKEESSSITLNNAEDVKFIYDIKGIPENQLNKVYKKYGSLMYMNKDMLRLNWSKAIGDYSGKLVVRPTSLVYYLNIEDDNSTYKIDVDDNNFLIPQDICTLDEDLMRSSTNQIFYVLDTNLNFNEVTLEIISMTPDIDIEYNEWKTDVVENTDSITYINYLKISDKYCMQLSIDCNTDLKDDIQELNNNIINLVSVEKQKYSTDNRYIATGVKNIKLADNIELNLENCKLTRWNSGSPSVVVKELIDCNSITFDVGDDWTTITEYGKKSELQEILDSLGITLSEYKYKGNEIYIGNITKESTLINNSIYIFFEVNGRWYELTSTREYNSKELDKWIDNTIKDILIWK